LARQSHLPIRRRFVAAAFGDDRPDDRLCADHGRGLGVELASPRLHGLTSLVQAIFGNSRAAGTGQHGGGRLMLLDRRLPPENLDQGAGR
jgi:hypothetical protein